MGKEEVKVFLFTDDMRVYKNDPKNFTKISMQFFTDLDRTILNFIRRNKNPGIAKIILNNKRTLGGITIPDFKLYHRALVIKAAWY